jgi:hypothetical protein
MARNGRLHWTIEPPDPENAVTQVPAAEGPWVPAAITNVTNPELKANARAALLHQPFPGVSNTQSHGDTPHPPALVELVKPGQQCGEGVRDAAVVAEAQQGVGQAHRWVVAQAQLEALQASTATDRGDMASLVLVPLKPQAPLPLAAPTHKLQCPAANV